MKKSHLFYLLVTMFRLGVVHSTFAQEAAVQSSTPTLEQDYTLLNSTDDVEREKASRRLLPIYNHSSEDQKAAIVKYVRQLLNDPNVPVGIWNDENTTRNLACFLAGEFKDDLAVPSLIQLLAPLPRQRVTARANWFTQMTQEGYAVPPAAIALVKIGSPAQEPLKLALSKTNDRKTRAYIHYVLEKIDKSKTAP